jgi:glycosyltransferase involved in cell wall biosynthesis
VSGITAKVRHLVGWRARHLFLKRLEGRLIHTTICVSEAVRQRLVELYGYPPARTSTIYNGIDLTRFRRPAPKSPPGDTMRIVCVARLNRVKRIDLLIVPSSGAGRSRRNCEPCRSGSGFLPE